MSDKVVGSKSGSEADQLLHASCVAEAGRAVLILGPSGAGKSALALKLLAYGAKLVADDCTALRRSGQLLQARCPNPALLGLIEARGIGLLRVAAVPEAPLALVVDLAQLETERLPPWRETVIQGIRLPLVLRSQNDHLPEAILLWLRGGRQE